jgi:hypothetical protein
MQKLSKGSIDADRRIMAKSRVCQRITGIEPDLDGRSKTFDRKSYNDRQWHSLFVYCWSHKEDFDFDYKAGAAAVQKPLTQAQMEKMGIEVEDDEHIVMKNKTYTEDELRDSRITKIKTLRDICIAKEIPDDGGKADMIAAILEAQELLKEE